MLECRAMDDDGDDDDTCMYMYVYKYFNILLKNVLTDQRRYIGR